MAVTIPGPLLVAAGGAYCVGAGVAAAAGLEAGTLLLLLLNDDVDDDDGDAEEVLVRVLGDVGRLLRLLLDRPDERRPIIMIN